MSVSEKQKVRNRRWYEKPENRAKAIAKAHERHHRLKDDPEFRAKRKAAQASWRAENPDKVKAMTARMRDKHGETMNERTRAWRKANPGVCTKQTRKYRGLPPASRPMPDACENCGGPPTGRGSLHLDHDHETNKFRGWLCQKCNVGLGLLGDNNFDLQRMSMYLMRAESAV